MTISRLDNNKRFLFLALTLLLAVITWAQPTADRILGIYKAKFDKNDAKVKVFRHDGGYRMQICWLRVTHNLDGTLKTDAKNPDQRKRTTPMSEVVLVERVTYEDGIWKNGRIYDPKSDKTYKVELRLSDDNKLEVRGIVGPFHKSFIWTKIQ